MTHGMFDARNCDVGILTFGILTHGDDDAATLWVISDAVNFDANIFLVIFDAVNFDTGEL